MTPFWSTIGESNHVIRIDLEFSKLNVIFSGFEGAEILNIL